MNVFLDLVWSENQIYETVAYDLLRCVSNLSLFSSQFRHFNALWLCQSIQWFGVRKFQNKLGNLKFIPFSESFRPKVPAFELSFCLIFLSFDFYNWLTSSNDEKELFYFKKNMLKMIKAYANTKTWLYYEELKKKKTENIQWVYHTGWDEKNKRHFFFIYKISTTNREKKALLIYLMQFRRSK